MFNIDDIFEPIQKQNEKTSCSSGAIQAPHD